MAVFNQKGGVGKTTTALNLAAALARASTPALMVDLDPQAHLSSIHGNAPSEAQQQRISPCTRTTVRCVISPSPGTASAA
jgi:chromosome partitioning protein